jgi:hypothetical protein
VEDEREKKHLGERLDDGPGGAQSRLLVAHLDVAPGEEVEQLAVAPEVGESELHARLLREDDGDGRLMRGARRGGRRRPRRGARARRRSVRAAERARTFAGLRVHRSSLWVWVLGRGFRGRPSPGAAVEAQGSGKSSGERAGASRKACVIVSC